MKINSTKRKKHVRTSKWSIPVELTLAAFFIGILLLLAFAANELGLTAAIIHNSQTDETYQAVGADIRPVSRPEGPDDNANSISHSDEGPPYTTKIPEDASTGQLVCTYQLDAFFSQFGSNIGIYFRNFDTGFVYTSNPDTVFFAASLNKATHALYTYIAAERGYIDIYAIHTFSAGDWWGGTGIIRFMPAGTRFTTRELLRHSVVYSDNVAFRMLTRYMNQISFSYEDFLAELGADPGFIKSAYSHYTTAADTAIWFYALHNYLESESRYGHYLLYDLLNTALCSHPYFTRGRTFGGDSRVDVRLLHTRYEIAQKYGWAVESFNVAGIVYADSPFMLVILSDMDNGAHGLFDEISQLMQDFNGRYF